ncbi:MAG: DNA replication/repair protein RecF [Patescibacteria group bacterium]|nr:DNA replication/repair protein RecF [Patescibacteria group bacterium]
MQIQKIHLQKYRNYNDQFLKLDPSKNISIFLGNNAQGKTNLLESIYAASLTKSFRTADAADMIAKQSDTKTDNKKSEIQLEYMLDEQVNRVSLALDATGKTVKKIIKWNDQPKKVLEYIGNLHVVLFEPNDMNLLILSPGLRRKYFDILLSQIDPEYLNHLSRYNRILKARNKLLLNILQERSQPDELYYWDAELVKSGAYIVWHRQKMLDFFVEKIQPVYHQLAGTDQDEVSIVYQSSIKPYVDIETTAEEFMKKLQERRSSDIKNATTGLGPHRDDYIFQLRNQDIASTGSRGEIRSMILALKNTEIVYIEEVKGTSPILLLDDVFSELDDNRKRRLIDIISTRQSFITTVEQDMVAKLDPENLQVFTIENGEIL